MNDDDRRKRPARDIEGRPCPLPPWCYQQRPGALSLSLALERTPPPPRPSVSEAQFRQRHLDQCPGCDVCRPWPEWFERLARARRGMVP